MLQKGDIRFVRMMLEASQLGLGSAWICYFKPDVISREFSLPAHLEPVNILAIGYAGEETESPDRYSRTRIPISGLISCEVYGMGKG